MDVKRVTIFCLFRILLPFALLSAVIFRFNFMSFLYLLCLLVNPLISCTWKGRVYALFGFHRYDAISIKDAFRLAGLDFFVMFVSVAVLVAIEKLQAVPPPPAENQDLVDGDISRRPVRRRKKRKSEVLYWTGETFVLFFLAGAGILYPSLSSAIYFLVFLTVCTWLSCNRKIGRRYLLTKIPLLIYCAIHFVSIYLYQIDFVQDYVPPDSLSVRLLGLPDFVHQNCTSPDPRTLVFQVHSWTIYASPFFVLGLYCLLSLIIRKQLLSPPVEECKYEPAMSRADSKQSSQYSQGSVRRRKSSRRMTRGQQEERARVGRTSSVRKLLDEDHTGRSYRTIDSGDAAAKETLAIDPNGSIIWTSESDMPEIVVDPQEEDKPPPSKSFSSKVKKVFNPILSALKLISKGSYIATLIIMMTWSITYHSWLTFVLLLWSCIIWMSPNSRYMCLRSSPALVFYAEALLVLQYIFGLNLTEDELPSKDVGQIGLVKYGDLTYQPLAIKMLYTVMFWITMRQFFEEKQQSSDRNIAEAIKRHFSIVPSVTSPNPYIRVVAETVSKILTKYWIWIVATMLMVISLGGQVVVVYRIVYMFLFLFFILMFQFSYQLWRRIMYGFWLTVIVFSMLVLIIIYTYQFKDFDYYWEKYLHVSKSVQRDLGLELYDSDTGTLFVKLLTPTFFLIITIIQLHYFHKDFLLISDIHYRSSEYIADTTQLTTASNIPNDSTETHITIEHENEIECPKTLDLKSPNRRRTASPTSELGTPTTPKKEEVESNRAEREFRAVKICLDNIFQDVQQWFTSISEILWRILEIHIIKVVLLSTFILAAYDVCAIHFAFVVFVVVALPLPALQSFFSHCMSIWVAVLLLSKMIYQLNIVDNLNWRRNCSAVMFINSSTDFPFPFNTTIDNHDWIGFKRTLDLANYCKGYIGLILVLTIQAVVKIRQEVNRIQLNLPEPKTGIIFPEATRSTADDNLLECIKYLANYFFYKFGLEFCYVTIVVSCGMRLDVFGFISAVWLSSMFLLKRKTLAKVWPVYVAYQCIVMTIQYLICLGLPPGLCIEYPWTEPLVEGLRDWLFLPNFQVPLNTTKIVADFFQLLFACCQLFVFHIETSPVAGLYEGGSNKEIDFNNPEPNPIPDFVTCKKTILDMLKVLIFYAFYWISLAVVFQAGTSRINLFAMGYVISCFYFLWNGNEFYLKSRPALLRMWNILLAYNVTVILFSCLLQLVGCTYFELLCQKQCWLVQLLGIACQQRVKDSPHTVAKCTFEPDPGLVYDIICFVFLLLQRRLFSSYYFQHVVNEVKAQQVLSSRGAELIHEIQMKEVQEQQANEKEIMERIKKKMDRIRAYQQKIRGGENMEPETHFQGIMKYMIIPFLYELRSLMDWIWTDTSMNVSNWLKMEDIYSNVFVLKCTRRAEADYPTPRGAKRTALIKYGVGGFLLFFIILIIWFPLLLFALGNTVGRSNTPVSCTVQLAITGYEPIFRTTALQHQIHKFSDEQWKDLENAVAKLAEPSTTSFLTGYDKDDTVLIELSNNSTSIWTISPPSQNALIQELRGDNKLKMILSWSFLRNNEDRETDPEVSAQKELVLDDPKLKQSLADALSVGYGNISTISGSTPESTTIADIFPNFVKIPSTGTASVVTTFYPDKKERPEVIPLFGKKPFRSLNISMWTGDMLNTSEILNSSGSHYVEWWEIQDDCYHTKPYNSLKGVNDCNFLRMVAFSDKAFPSELSLISGYGIVGLYTTFVLVVSRVVRGFVAGTSFTIMFDDMPYVDRVLQLCLDIYLVRESGEFTLEEDLFAKLIFLYRSPEMLIKWTRPPEPDAEEENEQRLQQ
ncbi:piezo-type mechanosensitive ion channel component [Caerostris darwini]|uniref:Piezo-type mechanosensitive ion channel component n=1 Tax=Caerostris darwini TaxID=1538125 RepID=A0AAV4Q1F6_9ARAC|nr:piezo-type mechanosensitive ion channel component [Caerostris darwini]